MIRHFKNKKKKLTRKKKLRLTAVQASVRFLTLFSYHPRAGYTDRKYTNFDSLLRYDAHRSHQETYFLSFRLWTWFFPCFVFRFNFKNWRKPVVLVSYQRHWVEQYVDLSSTRDANDTVNEHTQRERHTPGRRDQSVWQLLLFLSFHFVFFYGLIFSLTCTTSRKRHFFFFLLLQRRKKENQMEFDGRSVARANAIPRPSNDVMNTRHPERKKRKKEEEEVAARARPIDFQIARRRLTGCEQRLPLGHVAAVQSLSPGSWCKGKRTIYDRGNGRKKKTWKVSNFFKFARLHYYYFL